MADETISTQIVREYGPIEAHKLALVDEARRMYNQGITLPGFEAAGLSGTQRQAIDLAKQSTGVYQPYLEAAGQGVTRGMQLGQSGAQGIAGIDIAGQMQPGQAAMQSGITALTGTTGKFDPSTEVSSFMDPYRQKVIDAAMKQMDIQGQQAQNRAAAQAVGAGAFGSTRQGVQSAVLEGELAREKNAAIANLLSSGYMQSQQAAQQAFEAQQGRQLQQASQYGQLGQGLGSLGLQGAQLGVTRGSTLANIGQGIAGMGMQQGQLGQAAQGMAQADVSMLSQAGAIEQANRQAQLDAQRQTAYQQATAPMQQLAYVSDIYKGAPSSQMAITSQSSPSASPFQTIVGTGVGAATGIAGASKLFGGS